MVIVAEKGQRFLALMDKEITSKGKNNYKVRQGVENIEKIRVMMSWSFYCSTGYAFWSDLLT